MKSSDKETLKIVYSDNHVLVVEKPAHLLTQDETRDNLEDRCKSWIKKKFDKKGRVFLHAIHRLDKEVSGLVVFARTSKALSRLNEEMRKGSFRKIYYALVEGKVASKRGVLEDKLIHGSHKARIAKKGEGGKLAKLSYETVSAEKNSLLRIELFTGRYHQIRIQLAHFGHPILGDKKYGSKEVRSRIYLHAAEISFIHPTLKRRLHFKNPCPRPMTKRG